MVSLLLSLLLAQAHANNNEVLYRAGVSQALNEPWRKIASLPAIEIRDFDAAYGNTKKTSNRRFISTQFGETLKICQGEIYSLRQSGFKISLKSKKGWACVLESQKGIDKRFTAVKEIRRQVKNHSVFVTQAMFIEVGADKYVDFDRWLSGVRTLR